MLCWCCEVQDCTARVVTKVMRKVMSVLPDRSRLSPAHAVASAGSRKISTAPWASVQSRPYVATQTECHSDFAVVALAVAIRFLGRCRALSNGKTTSKQLSSFLQLTDHELAGLYRFQPVAIQGGGGGVHPRP